MPRRPNYLGLVFGVLFLLGSLTPSLLPRPWLFQGMMTGILVSIGYAVGTFLSYVWRQFGGHEPSVRTKWWAWRVIPIVSGTAIGAMLWSSSRWQRDLHELVGATAPSRWSYVAATLVAVAMALVLIAIGRAVLRLTEVVAHPLSRWVPPRVAGLASGVLLAVIVVGFLDGLVGRSLFFMADQIFRTIDRAQAEAIDPPSDELRSGSKDSLVAWQDLSSEGRRFVTGGPTHDELVAFSGPGAIRPIRAYAGLTSRAEMADRADLVVADLERAGGFDRAVLAVMTTTGRGWIDPPVVNALEYLWGGDTAVAAMQYSYLPSWISHLADGTRAREAGAALFEAVYARWSELPEGERPLLLVAGESLGADGSQAAFSGIDDVRIRTDGALWIGSPNFSPLWDIATDGREPGTPEYQPMFEGGMAVRFVDRPEDLEVDGIWERPRVAFLQHAADPVVWWSPRLILRRPDWLEEQRGRGVLPEMRWYPMVTFWQVTADLANSRRVPPGHGHNYGVLAADAWAAIAPPPGWTDQDTDRLRAQLMSDLPR